jgi:diguanylate cyclase (GGDEF)-like protein
LTVAGSSDGAAEAAVHVSDEHPLPSNEGAALPSILRVITELVEREIPGSRASILLLDDDGEHLRVAAGPSLSADYHDAIDGSPIGPGVGTCGTAAYEQRVVVTPSIADDPAWDDWRALAEAAGLAACWSTPFLGPNNRVLGTFAVYFDEPRMPTPAELALLHDAGYLTAVAVQHNTVRQLLRDTRRTNPVTGMPNRLVLDEQLRTAEAMAQETGEQFGVIQVAITGISSINESLGPTVGDAVLRAVADRLTSLVNGSGQAAHLWGSDFVVLVNGLTDVDEAQATAERLRDALTKPFKVSGMTFAVGVSVGLATYGRAVDGDTRSVDEPLRTAHVALVQARSVGREQIGVYDRQTDPAADTLLIGDALRRGMEQEELTLAYQPIVAFADGHVDHYEALLRWTGQYGEVAPDAFVAVAEQTGLVDDLGRYALKRALAELASQRAAGHDIGMSVNLSVRQLADDQLPDLVAQLLADFDVPPEKLIMEVTESVLLTSSGTGWSTLGRIRDSGVRISLDDFGTGFTQISYLRRFAFDEIKIDRSFVRDMERDIVARAIIVGTIGFALAAGLATVAEGVEQRDQADRLRELGCTHGQGYLFGAPSPTASPA